MDVQANIRGVSPSAPYAIPSREELRESGMQELRRMLSLGETKARQAAYPQETAGQYGLEEARLKGSADVEAARYGFERSSAERQTQREFQAEQNRLNREAIAGRETQAQGAMAERAGAVTERIAGTSQAVDERARRAQRARRITDIESGKVSVSYPGNALMGWLTQGSRNRAEVSRLQAENSQFAPQAQRYLARYADLDDVALRSLIQQQEDTATPEELQELLNTITALRGR
jgi:hypothetical protein